MKTVNFTEMKNGSKEEYLMLDKHEQNYISRTAERILKFMGGLNSTLEGYKITRLEHSLQAATRAFKDGADEEMVVATLLHDIGDELAPLNHSEYAASVLKPFVSEKWDAVALNPSFRSSSRLSRPQLSRCLSLLCFYYTIVIGVCQGVS